MNAEIFAEWLRRQGYLVERTSSSYWYEVSSHVYQAFPYHWVIQPTEEELNGFLRQRRGIALRYSTPIDRPIGCISYHGIYDRPSYSLETLGKWARKNVRAGLRNCHIEQISLERFAEEGWVLEMDTASRQRRRITMSKDIWRRKHLAIVDLPGFEAWGALVGERLVASLLAFQMEDCCEMIAQQCHRDYLKAHVNNALAFVVTQTMINRIGIRSIFYTLQSLDAPASVDEFKFRLGYIAKPVRQRVVFHPYLKPLANNLTHKILIWLLNRDPANQFLAKSEGLFRFYLNGKRPLNDQNWSEFLADRKMELLAMVNFSGESKQV